MDATVSDDKIHAVVALVLQAVDQRLETVRDQLVQVTHSIARSHAELSKRIDDCQHLAETIHAAGPNGSATDPADAAMTAAATGQLVQAANILTERVQFLESRVNQYTNDRIAEVTALIERVGGIGPGLGGAASASTATAPSPAPSSAGPSPAGTSSAGPAATPAATSSAPAAAAPMHPAAHASTASTAPAASVLTATTASSVATVLRPTNTDATAPSAAGTSAMSRLAPLGGTAPSPGHAAVGATAGTAAYAAAAAATPLTPITGIPAVAAAPAAVAAPAPVAQAAPVEPPIDIALLSAQMSERLAAAVDRALGAMPAGGLSSNSA